MKVAIYTINKGTAAQYFGLKNAEENTVLHASPNNWKTKRGAINWAKKHGYELPCEYYSKCQYAGEMCGYCTYCNIAG